MNEREKAVENRYEGLLSESYQKLHSQGQVIRRLAESTNQKDLDLLLQVPKLFFYFFKFFCISISCEGGILSPVYRGRTEDESNWVICPQSVDK